MFDRIVCEEVASEWLDIQEWRDNHRKAAATFEKTVMKLRALKYTRQVTRPFNELSRKHKQIGIKAVLCSGRIPAQFSRTKPVDLKISIIVDRTHKKFALALKRSLEQTKRPPISHYGIRSRIEVVTYSAIRRRKGSNNVKLYYYPESKPRRFVAKGTFQELLRNGNGAVNGKKSILPMLSNIPVDVSWAKQS